ncbi:hypothetical protein BJ170DRAFT_687981 [Xylariales sp. AK1849]|nr:hypothetical protein BJ170DRAFT_687981 [Xylariales sp. AK1849]
MSILPLPFLYQTRILLRSRYLPVLAIRRSLHATTSRPGKGDSDIPFAQDVPGEDVPMAEPEPPGTITATERQAFERIFADIAARGLVPNMQQDLPPPSSTAQRSTNLILERAAADAGQQRSKPIMSPVSYAGAARDKAKALLRFPPSLRAAAGRAFELLHPDHPAALSHQPPVNDTGEGGKEWRTPKNTFMRAVELDAKRYPEQKRVERLMSAAKTDFELWDVMENEVFSYPDKLGVRKSENTKQDHLRTKETSKRKTGKATPSAEAIVALETNASTDQPHTAEKLNLYVYGPLYPSFLLFGLRLLDQAFSKPSPLALSVLPRVKELGLESFVLGVSTPFYNELLGIHYGRYGDLSKMLDLLEEMRHSGLYFDTDTVSILNRTQLQTEDLANGKYGAFATAFMTMPEYEQSMRDRIRHWHRAIDISLAQRDADIDYQRLQH